MSREQTTERNGLSIDAERLARVCEQHSVSRLEIFGGFARGEGGPDSDVDLLVTFSPGTRIGLGIVALQQALEEVLGRRVDLLTRDAVERSPNKYFRHFALRRTEPLYECA